MWYKVDKTVKVECNINDEEYIDLEADVEVTIAEEKGYGEDADGNRGEDRTYIADIKIVSIRDEGGNEVRETENIIIDINEKIEALFEQGEI